MENAIRFERFLSDVVSFTLAALRVIKKKIQVPVLILLRDALCRHLSIVR